MAPNQSKMLWWKQIERVQENVMMIEREERRREYVDSTTVTLTLPTRDPVLQDNLLIANLEQVKSLQASLFPICTKGIALDIKFVFFLPDFGKAKGRVMVSA